MQAYVVRANYMPYINKINIIYKHNEKSYNLFTVSCGWYSMADFNKFQPASVMLQYK